ncbi:MAG TPA: alpha-2-macroglobulin family protein, partial [Chthonomonadales bacterium]|nr:alpha-2-macroglobulin family protein [Chthonomonadales bacterium]
TGYQGAGVTDEHGELKLDIKTKRLPVDRTLDVTATVTDLSRRSQAASGDTLITAGLFTLSVAPQKYLYRPGDSVTVTVHAADYDTRPVAVRARVTLMETMLDRYHRPYLRKTVRDALTGTTGDGVAHFKVLRPGYLTLQAEAFDSDDNKITATGYIWVAGEDVPSYDYPTLSLVADKSAYRPGEIGMVLLNTSLVSMAAAPASGKVKPPRPHMYRHAWALITVEGEGLYSTDLTQINSRTTVLKIPIAAQYFPSVHVNATIVQDGQVYEQSVALQVRNDKPKLSVEITPTSARFSPGKKVTYRITTRDYLGRPAPAEVAVSVVDASVYAIEPDNAAGMFGFFYGEQADRVETSFSFSAIYSGGAYQTVPGGRAPASGKPDIRVRKQFADTAFWGPFVATGESGAAEVTFTLPDNLTTWRATAHGMTLATAVGSASNDTVSAMPLMVRLELPRFYVEGDTTVVSAVIHNYSGTDRSVQVHLKASGAEITGETSRTIEIKSNGQQRVDWKARIAAGAESASFAVVADGGEGAQDAAELSLPVRRDGVAVVDASTKILSADRDLYTADLTKLPPGA